LILIDAGPLVALIHGDDRHHASCKQALKRIRDPLGTVWPAFTEAMYLLGFSSKAQDALWRLLEVDAVRILPLDASDAPRMRDLMRKYKVLPMGLADAALVRVAERERLARIFTIDRRDFQLYRPRGLPRFTIIP
jgi:predicted nucleic acid-binding protein